MSAPSMPFARLRKSPGDDLPYNWDFSDEPVFATSPITAAEVTDWQGNPVTGVTVGAPAISSPIVQTRISGGTVGMTPYFLKCRATNAAGHDREAFLALWVSLPTPDA